MRPRIVAASTAAFIAVASIAPITAQAATQNTLYVSTSAACTDSGTGTATAPYCTIQAAANAANPGDTVSVLPGSYAATTITHSGTAADPITFTGNGIWSIFGTRNSAVAAFDISGASHVRIQNFGLVPGPAADAVVDGGSDITFSNDSFRRTTVVEPSLHVTNAASAVTVRDSYLLGEVLVDGGSTGTVLTTNRVISIYAGAVSVVGAANTAITGNTISGCGPSVSITDSATATAVENNVINNPDTTSTSASCPATSQALGIDVDSSAAASTSADYNDVYVTGAGSAGYNWAGTAYPSAAGLFAAAGQAKHDDNSLLGTQVTDGSPLINSADSAAIGEQPVDFNGQPRVRDPLTPATGAGPYNYYDRGALQLQDPLTRVSTSFTSSATKAPVGANITLKAAITDTWSDTFDYQFKLSNGTTVDAGTSGTAAVSFSTPGTYTATLYIIPTNGATPPTQAMGSVTVSAAAPTPLVPKVWTSASGRYDVLASDYGTTDDWNVTSVSLDFGDQTPVQIVADGVSVDHTYPRAGTYTITETVTDQNGASATTSTKFSTNALVAGTLINSNGLSTFTPANSTGIVQAAVASLPDKSNQLLAATTGGTVEFATGTSFGNVWKDWQVLSQPGVTAKWVGITGMPNGSSQLIEITAAGTLLHTIRNANGTWQSSWASPARSTGFTHAAITAMPDGSAQLVAVTTAGVLMHNIRFANGSWQGWGTLSQSGVKVVDASIGGDSEGWSQVVEVTSTGVIKHNIRYVGGAWQGWGVPAQPAGIVQASIDAGTVFTKQFGWGAAFISVVTSQGGLENVTRNSDGSWSTWWGTTSGIGDLGTAVDTTVSVLPDSSLVQFAVAGG
ncbi:MAG TPA: PKD domain-containing protein [Actinocrinis sp.]|nr:PKD domain-containing protein [Actinocrinis sp.]